MEFVSLFVENISSDIHRRCHKLYKNAVSSEEKGVIFDDIDFWQLGGRTWTSKVCCHNLKLSVTESGVKKKFAVVGRGRA